MKKRLLWEAGGTAVFIAALIGCQTTRLALIEPAQSAIQVEKSGFFPGASDGRNSIDISVLLGNSDAINSWRSGDKQ